MDFTGYYSLILKLVLLIGQRAIISSTASKTLRNASLTDLSKCKLTQFGTDYMGTTSTTVGGIRCQMWHTEKPVHKVSEAITDTDVPERSLQLARNYCRNPTTDPRGPWCYTMEPTLIDDECEVPLCNFGECRVSGTGSEYGGTHDTTSSGRNCKSWDKRLKLAVNKTEKFSNNRFSDLSRNKAKNFCRNPDSSSGGPWCWVDSENYNIVEKEYCSIPFCDDKDCLVYSKNASVYSTLTSLNSTFGNISFWIKLWNPADEQIGQARLLFTNLQVPTSAEEIAEEWGAGVEIVVSNSGSGQQFPRTDDETDFEETPNILLGSKWTGLWVAWGGGFISVGHQGSTKPIFLDEFEKKNTISSLYPESFFQYGIMGTGVLWSMQLCEDTCEMHTTFGVEFLRVWPLLQSNNSHDLQFYVRASHKATIQLTQTPAVPFPCYLIVIGQHNSTMVMYQREESALKEILLDLETKTILNFWAWHEFTISIFGMAIQMFWHRDYGREEVFSIEHHNVPSLRWFSIGSENTITHWTLFCAPTEADAVEPPWFPNCISSSSDSRYEGSQWTTENQIPCIPWTSDRIPKNDKPEDIFIDGSALKALNKCRNPTNDPAGPFCYTATRSGSSPVKKQYCPIRKCRSSGTANDYLGTVSVTRSGRNCARWVSGYEQVAAPRKNISLGSLMARAFLSLKVKRENAFEDSILDIPSHQWDEIGLRMRLPRDAELPVTWKTPRHRRVRETHNQNGIHKLVKYAEILATSSESPEDDDDDNDDFFKLKPATFSPKKSSKATFKSNPGTTHHQEIRTPDKLFKYYPGTFQPYRKEITHESSEDDDDDDFFKLKPATFPPKKSSKATSKSSPGTTHHQEIRTPDKLFKYYPGTFQPYRKEITHESPEDDDDDDFFKLKPATFPPKKSSKATSKSSPGTTRHQEIRTTDKLHNYYPGTFQPYGFEEITTESPDDDDDFFKLKPATFPLKKSSKATAQSSPGTTRHQEIRTTDKLHNYYPGTFQPYGFEEITTESPDDDDDDFFKLKPATFPPKKSSKATSKSSPGTTRHQEIRTTDKVHNYYPGTFQPYGFEEITTESPDDDDDFFKLKPATFPLKKSSKATAQSSPGTTRHQEIRTTDKLHNYYPGTFQPYGFEEITTESPDDDDDDFFKLKPATFPPKKSSKATSKSSPGTTRHQEIRTTDKLHNYYPGTFQPYGFEEITTESPDDDDDFFKLKPATFPLKKSSKATAQSSPGTTRHQEIRTTDKLHNYYPGTFQPYGFEEITTESPDDDDDDFFKLKPATFPPKKSSKATSKPSPGTTRHQEIRTTDKLHNYYPGTFQPYGFEEITTESPDDDDDDFFKLKPATFPPKKSSKATSKPSPGTTRHQEIRTTDKLHNYYPGTFQPYEFEKITTESPDDDDDFFKLKPATFPLKKSSEATSKPSPGSTRHQEIRTTDKLHNYYPGTFQPYGFEEITTESPDDDDDDDFFKLKPATFPPKKSSKATSKPSPGTTRHQEIRTTDKLHNYYPGTFQPYEFEKITTESPDDDDDFFKLKPATFPLKKSSKATSKSSPGTTRHQEIRTTDKLHNYYPGTFQPYGFEEITTESPDDDDDDDFFKLKPATFPPKKSSKATSKPSPGTTRHQEIRTTDKLHNYYPGTFQPYEFEKITTESPDDDDDFFKLKPATFPLKKSSKATSKSSPGTTRHQEIRTTDKLHNYYPGTFQPYGFEEITTESPDDDDDDDFFKLKPATFPPKKSSKATSKPSPGTTRHQEIRTTDKLHNYYPGTFQPYGLEEITTESPDDDDDDFFKLKPATFPPKKSSKATSKPSPGTTRHQEIRTTDKLHNYYPGTFQPYGLEEITTESPDDDDDDFFKLKPATFPPKKSSKATSKPSPGTTRHQEIRTTDKLHNYYPGTFQPYGLEEITTESPDDDDDDFFKLKPATFPPKKSSKATSKSSPGTTHHQEIRTTDKLHNYYPGTFQPYGLEEITTESPDDDDDDFFKLKPATFPPKKSSKATSKPSPGTTRHQEIRTTDKLHNYYPGTFQPYGLEEITTESPDDDDDDFFKLKPATFPPKKSSKATSKSSPGTTHHQEIRTTDKLHNYYPGTFQPYGFEEITTESPDDDDDDFFKLKPATFPPKKSSKATSKPSPGTTRHQEIRTTDKLHNYYPGTFQPYEFEKITTESPDDDDDFFKLKPATFPPKKSSKATSKPSPGTTRHQEIRTTDKLHNYYPGTFQPYGLEEITTESPDDDDDDFFKLKPATFPPKRSSEATSKPSPGTTRHQEIRTTDKLHNYYPGTFQPYGLEEITTESPDDDDDDFFKLKPATFPPKKSSKATSKPSPGTTRHQEIRTTDKLHNYYPGTFQPYGLEEITTESPDDDDDFFKLKSATFPLKKSSKATSKSSPGTTRHQEIRTTDKLHNYYPGTFQPYGLEEITTESPDDDDDDFFKLKPATFPPKKSSKATSKPSPGTTRHQEIRTTDKLHNYYPGTFQPYGLEEITTESPDDDDDFFKLKPATFPLKKSSKATSKSSPGTTRHQEIRTTDKLHNYYPGTFQPYGFEEITTESPDDDDDDFFKLKPATFPPKKSSKATSKPSPGTTRHQEIRTTDKLHNYYPGTFQPYGLEEITTESPDDDDDDFFKLKPATFPPKKSSKATSKPSPGTTRHQEIRTTDKLHNYYPGTFQPYGFEEITTESQDDDNDDFSKLKPSTFPPKKNSKPTSKTTPGTTRHQETWETTSERPNDDDNLLNHHPGTFQPYEITETTYISPAPRDVSTNDSSLTTLLSLFNNTPKNPTPEKFSHTTPPPQSTESSKTISTTKNNASTPIPKVDPRYLNDTLYPDQNVRNASNYCRNPSRNIAGTWCYTTDPDVPQDLCNIRDCEKPEECIFLVRGHGSGRRLYVLPEYRSEGLHFSLKEWEPDHPDSITFVILSEDDVQSRLILKVGAMNNEKVLLYYETKEKGIKLVKQKTLPHLLYLGRWTGFVLRMDRGEVKLYYEGAPYPLFEWKDPEPAKAFLPIYYYYSSEGGNSIGVAFNCDTKCHIEQTTTTRFSRILPISIWETEETPSPHKLVLMLRGEGVVLLPLLMLPTTPGYYALTIGEMGQWVFFIKNKLPAVHILHKQDANGPLFTSDTWTNITITFHNTTIRVLRNNTEVFNYIHNLPLLFYLFSLSVDTGGWVTWAANCIPTDIDGAPLDGGWSEWGPWTCSASCNGGMGVRKRTCDNPEPNIRGQPCLGPSTMNGHCNMNKCGDVTDVTLALIKRRIQIQHKSIIIKEGDEATLSADTDIVSALRNETPTSEINWSRNGIFLEEEEDRVKLEDTTASISYSVVNDSGVYTQTLHRVDDSDLIFKIISLAVIPERNELVIRKSLPFSVTCNCVVLGYIYSDLKISWILNGKVFKDYGVSTPIAINVDHIPEANMSHHGEWRCEVVQSDLNFKWTTNVIKVRVLGPPNWRTHLMEDKLTRPIFGWMPSEGFVAFSAFFLTILIIVGIVSSTIWYLRFRESLKYKDLPKNDPIDSEESFNDSETEQLIVNNKKSK